MATQLDTTKTTASDPATLRLKGSEKRQAQDDSQQSYVDSAIERSGATINWAAVKAKQTLDRVVPPEQSSALAERFQEFAKVNPKLTAFILVNLIFSGMPLLLFTAFSISVFIFSIVTGLILGLVGALIFASSTVGFTLLFLVPALLLTTVAATTVFFWTIVGLYVYTQIDQRNKRRSIS